jgi:hypothetical protein
MNYPYQAMDRRGPITSIVNETWEERATAQDQKDCVVIQPMLLSIGAVEPVSSR